ncbi:CPXCG motif-containing cysteine-rich protein [Paraferrimonas sedimenticola]|uniref:CPXCG motif-containing cysteine-rich protein n=1 Tax=Paraferrimonas sedimenticola TaxID=375674 RepID=A0AA37RVJ3_9GAMM|nr:CPXCG motif-containing cysteine-rich protein [Paraferrimonas sedimenticola]GLP96141.1 CPXCG motif-containing cysteine-rich protein [Paraferrimonas sedimenticola]
MSLRNQRVSCPHCGHHFHLQLDTSQGDQDFSEDCPNCCHPIHCQLHINELNRTIEVHIDADNEQYY